MLFGLLVLLSALIEIRLNMFFISQVLVKFRISFSSKILTNLVFYL